MDSDEPYKQRKNSNTLSSALHVLQPFRVRCSFQDGDGINRFLLDYGFNFLPYISIISWVIFLIA